MGADDDDDDEEAAAAALDGGVEATADDGVGDDATFGADDW